MRPLRILTLAFLLFTLTAAAQTDRRIEEQKRVIAALEKRIATEEQEISKIQKGRTATEERVRRLACQIDSRNQLLDEVWGFDYFGDSRTVDVHVKRLREKLEGVSDKWSLKTVWGVGYKFEVL